MQSSLTAQTIGVFLFLFVCLLLFFVFFWGGGGGDGVDRISKLPLGHNAEKK